MLSPCQRFGDGIWVIPEGISLGLISFKLAHGFPKLGTGTSSSTITRASVTSCHLGCILQCLDTGAAPGGSKGRGDTPLLARHAAVGAAGWGAVSC